MKKKQTDYDQLFQISREGRILEGIHALLSWDQETMMPPGASPIRAEQLSLLAGAVHKQMTGRNFAQALAKLVDIKSGKIRSTGLTTRKKAAVREWRKEFIKKTALPLSFVEEFARLTSQAVEVWRVAKKENSFSKFAPFLDRIVSMNRKQAELLGYKEHPYDALLDLFEDGMTTSEITSIFSRLKEGLTPLVKKIASSKQVDDSFLRKKYPEKEQMAFGELLLNAMGCDKMYGRLDLSSHPFCQCPHPTDSRVTTRIKEKDLMASTLAVLHEAGHSLYEKNLPIKEYGSPLGSALSMGMHESQSRWWETRIGQSKPFWKFFLPLLKKLFKGNLNGISLDAFYKGINKVQPSPIRLEADELTYSLHIIARFELERDLIDGTLRIRDLPAAWKEKIGTSLGTPPTSDAEGCLQDIHWSTGSFGYFPTYILGNLYASQFFEGFVKDHKNWEDRASKGELRFISDWLRDHIHIYGKEFSSKELLKKATGKAFSEKPFLSYLEKKYSEIYRLGGLK